MTVPNMSANREKKIVLSGMESKKFMKSSRMQETQSGKGRD